jgi:predicted Rossmann fold nucleotide-binding protein DprA/Smf involved in DNA uptake
MEATLMAALSEICTPIDMIVQQTGLSAQQVSVLLLSLELSGQVKSVPGGIVRLNNR